MFQSLLVRADSAGLAKLFGPSLGEHFTLVMETRYKALRREVIQSSLWRRIVSALNRKSR